MGLSDTGLSPPLATPEQARAERLAVRLLEDPVIRKLLDEAEHAGRAEARLAQPGAAEGLRQALRLWTTGLILREAAGDFEAPAILWVGDTGPRRWMGHTLAGAAICGDNPDTIYRHAFVDGTAVYELTGTRPHNPAAELSIEPLPGLAGVIPPSGSLTGKIGAAGGPPMLTDRDLRFDSAGRFRVVLGGEPPDDGALHMALPPEAVAINTRDVFSDWAQDAYPLALRRLSPPRGPKLSEDAIRDRVIAHLPDYVGHWRRFGETWLGGLAPNTFKGPLGRAGSWSYILAGRFSLRPGEAAVLTGRPGGAGYHGCQITDTWMVSLDNMHRQASLNAAQATPDSDGWVSYVIAPEDPGVANWLDTGGLMDGLFIMRWQLFGSDFTPEGLVRGYEVVPAAEVARRRSLAPISPQERRTRLEGRAAAYARRTSG